MELRNWGRKSPPQPKILLLLAIVLPLLLLAIIPIYYPLLGYPIYLLKHYSSNYSTSIKPSSSSPHNDHHDPKPPTVSPLSPPPPSFDRDDDQEIVENCDVFSGEWMPNPEAPYYTNTTCYSIHEHQNCMKYGRPDTDFMKWRWKPDGCDLPVFDPARFLEILRGKSLAFVGDSVSRNQIQSLICLLSRVEYPTDVSNSQDDQNFKRWEYKSYNFTLSFFWTRHLVRSKEVDINTTKIFSLYLDESDPNWTTNITEFDYLIISAGHWFFPPSVYYENNQISGCLYGVLKGVPILNIYYGYRKAFRTALKAINEMGNFKGITFLRTFSPPHFENGLWNEGGNCPRTVPYKRNETALEGESLDLYKIQLEEFKAAEEEGKKKGKKFRLLDTTKAFLLRPDGHPNNHSHWPHEVNVHNDCVHWCLPGPIDSLNDFLMYMLRKEKRLSLKPQV